MTERSRVRVPTGTAGEFPTPGSTFSADSFQHPFQPRVTAVSSKRSRSFCQKCKSQVTAKHGYLMYVASNSDTLNWCMVGWCTQNLS